MIIAAGWFFAASRPSPRVTVLVFNGNAGNRAHRGPWAAAPPKTLLILPDADHNDYELLAGDKMMQAIARFLRTLT